MYTVTYTYVCSRLAGHPPPIGMGQYSLLSPSDWWACARMHCSPTPLWLVCGWPPAFGMSLNSSGVGGGWAGRDHKLRNSETLHVWIVWIYHACFQNWNNNFQYFIRIQSRRKELTKSTSTFKYLKRLQHVTNILRFLCRVAYTSVWWSTTPIQRPCQRPAVVLMSFSVSGLIRTKNVSRSSSSMCAKSIKITET